MNNRVKLLRNTVAIHLLTSWGKWMDTYHHHGDRNEENDEAWKIYYKPKGFIFLTKDAPLAVDITALCAIFTICGPFMLSYQSEMDEAAKEVITFLFEKYNIHTVLNSEFSEVQIENPRISLLSVVRCFPNVCCELYSLGICGPMVPSNILGKTFKTKKRAILCPLFPMVASEILLKPDNTNILPQLLWIACNVNFVCRKRNKMKKNVENIWNRLKQDLRSKLITEEVRVKLCVNWDILDERYKLNNMILNTRSYCLVKLDYTFLKDPVWRIVKKEMEQFTV